MRLVELLQHLGAVLAGVDLFARPGQHCGQGDVPAAGRGLVLVLVQDRGEPSRSLPRLGWVPGPPRGDLGVGGGVVGGRVVRPAVREDLRQPGRCTGADPPIPATLRGFRVTARGQHDDAVAAANLAPRLSGVADGPAWRHGEQVVTAARVVLAGRLERHRRVGEDPRQLGVQVLRVVYVHGDQPGPAAVQGDAVLGPGQPGDDQLRVPAGLGGPALPEHRAGVFPDADGGEVHPGGRVGQRCGDGVLVDPGGHRHCVQWPCRICPLLCTIPSTVVNESVHRCGLLGASWCRLPVAVGGWCHTGSAFSQRGLKSPGSSGLPPEPGDFLVPASMTGLASDLS